MASSIIRASRTPLIRSLETNNLKLALKLSRDFSENVNGVDLRGQTALMISIFQESMSLFRNLIVREDTNVNHLSKNGYSALIMAVNKDISIFDQLLIRKDILVNRHAPEGVTPLIFAIQYKRVTRIEKLLLKDGIDPYISYKDKTPVEYLEKADMLPTTKKRLFKLLAGRLDSEHLERKAKTLLLNQFYPNNLALLILDYDSPRPSQKIREKYNL